MLILNIDYPLDYLNQVFERELNRNRKLLKIEIFAGTKIETEPTKISAQQKIFEYF